MNKKHSTPQEEFWAGEFGDAYTDRNADNSIIASNIALFSKILSKTTGVQSVLELGANRGLNLIALKSLLPKGRFVGVEINEKAAAELRKQEFIDVHNTSIIEFSSEESFSMVLIKGVMIHLNPTVLDQVYDLMVKTSSKYICIAEYYNPTPVAIPYRGHDDRLFKRDFAGEIMGRHPNLALVDYGFAYHKDPNFPQDDITWFLMQKSH